MEYRTRFAVNTDISAIVSIEQVAYKETGAVMFSAKHVESWLNIYPEGVMVIEHRGSLVGFCAFQIINFNPDGHLIAKTYDELTDNGYIAKTHVPTGNCFSALTLNSIDRGAGKILLKAVLGHMRRSGRRFAFGTSRIIGFRDYINAFALVAGLHEDPFGEDVAIWYARECVRLTQGMIGSLFPRSAKTYPSLVRPDPILGFYLANNFEMHSFLPNFIEDPPSGNHACLSLVRLNA